MPNSHSGAALGRNLGVGGVVDERPQRGRMLPARPSPPRKTASGWLADWQLSDAIAFKLPVLEQDYIFTAALPPSAQSADPVTKLDISLARKSAAWAISSG